MKLFITGGGGMVGSCLVARAKQLGLEILAPRHSELELLDGAAVESFLHKHRPDLIIHLAARVGGIQANIDNPVGFLSENLSMGLNIIQSAVRLGIPKVLNIASSCMYPKDQEVLTESMVGSGNLEPTNEGYALAKISITRLCQYICRQHGYAYKTLIPCNLYGPGDNFSLTSGHMIPSAIRKVHQAKQESQPQVSIWGDGTARREFMYVDDLVDFILLAIDRIDAIPPLVNVGLGRDFSVNEYYRFIADAVGYRGDFHHDLSKPVGMKRKLLDTSIAAEWGWKAKTSIEEGVRLTYESFLSL